MSVSTLSSNLTALLNKAYNTATQPADSVSQLATEATAVNETNVPASASTQVILGGTSNATGTYTAKGLMQHIPAIPIQ